MSLIKCPLGENGHREECVVTTHRKLSHSLKIFSRSSGPEKLTIFYLLSFLLFGSRSDMFQVSRLMAWLQVNSSRAYL